MAKASVYSILAALLFAVHSTTAFNFNVRDEMTEAERRAHGFEYSGTKYNVFPMSLTGMEHKRKARENINCTLVLNGETIKLNLKPTSQYLATKYIPVWLADSDRHAYNNISYTPLLTAMSDIGEFTMYHDLENQAALVVYEDRSEKIVIEGNISRRYAIRSVPKRFINKFKNTVTNMSKIPNMMGGAITSYEDTGFYAVINASVSEGSRPYDLAKPENAARQKRIKSNKYQRKVPKKIYPEILLHLDHNLTRHRSIPHNLRLVLAFWNGIGMFVRSLDKPQVRPNIAGIIIANDYNATRYITTEDRDDTIFDTNKALSEMRKFFYEERCRFPVKQYDLIVAMTPMELVVTTAIYLSTAEFVPGYSDLSLKCVSKRDITKAKAVKNTFIVLYDVNFGVSPVFREFGFLIDRLNSECDPANRRKYVGKFGVVVDDNLLLDECYKKKYSAMFTTKETECYRNKPMSIQPVDKVVPGRWLSMDGQCQNEGYTKSCKLKNQSRACKEKGCRFKDSKKCVRSKEVPLVGSKCGTNKHCNIEKRCVKKL